MKDHYVRNGISCDKIRIVGDVSYDQIYKSHIDKKNIRKNITEKYSLNQKKDIVLISLPQLAEHNLMSWDRHWNEIDYLVSQISLLGLNVLISLHPKMEKKMYLFLEMKYACHIVEERLANVLPVANLFVSTFSSTILWSVICGIKTVVVDFYDLDQNIYNYLKTILIVKEKKQLISSVKRYLKSDSDFCEDWSQLSRSDVFTGKSISKYIELIGEIT
jgi:hypothetical protein